MRSTVVYIFFIALLISFTFPGVLVAQHTVSISFSGATALESSNNDISQALNLEYQYKFASVKDKLFAYASLTGFYQPKTWEVNRIVGPDTPEFEQFRYGGGFLTGFYLQGSIINTELGFGLSRHVIKSRQPSFGFIGPGFIPDYSLPKYSSYHYTNFDIMLSLNFELPNSLFIKPSLKIQTIINRNPRTS